MTAQTRTLSAIKTLLSPAQFHQVEPGALLADLLPCEVMREQGLPNHLELTLGISEIGEREIKGWSTIADVIASVDRRLAMNELVALGQEFDHG
jgi:hypothetical protein